MRIGSPSEYIELTELEKVPSGTPAGVGDVMLRVTVRLQSFNGSYDQVWVRLSEMQEFLQQLEALEKSRSGHAKLSSMSPDEFTLEIRSADALGHMEIETQLHRYQYSGPKYWPIYLRGGFEVEPHAIVELITFFEELTQ